MINNTTQNCRTDIENPALRKSPALGYKLLLRLCPILRSFPIEIRGEENLLQDNAVFVCNHTNSHDTFVALEVFNRLGRKLTTFVASDGLSILGKAAFTMGNCVFANRTDKADRAVGFQKFCGRISAGEDGFIFPESTWNLHPTLPMQKLNAGFVRVSLATGRPIVPVIFEYVEVPTLCKKESELYSRCIVSLGNPIFPSSEEDLFAQAEKVRDIMAQMRITLWNELEIERDTLDRINTELYLNHVDMRKNRAFGFQYDSEYEPRFLLEKENEFFLDAQGKFVPCSQQISGNG